MKILAILQNAYAGSRTAKRINKNPPRFFTINRNNYTGKKLYKMAGDNRMVVTNACPQWGTSADSKGKTDERRLREVMFNSLIQFELFLVCGTQAKEAVESIMSDFTLKERMRFNFIFMPHPASRNLTNKLTDKVAFEIKKMEKDFRRGNEFLFTQYNSGFKLNRSKIVFWRGRKRMILKLHYPALFYKKS